ncbi:MAG: DnaJ domain-containing protein [Bacteroidales bacterium]|jgi:DnaJ like chaperone protein|nr:DnaJ domain-containing protein [Bacteroidales bacterium]
MITDTLFSQIKSVFFIEMYPFFAFILGWIFTGSFTGGLATAFIVLIINRLFLRRTVRSQKHYKQQDFTHILMVFTAHLVQSDGDTIKYSELNYVKKYLVRYFDTETAKELLISLRDILNSPPDINVYCAEVNKNATIHEKLYILQFLFGLATVDGSFIQSELQSIQMISDLIGVSRNDFESIKAMYVMFNTGAGFGYGNGYGQGYGGYSQHSSSGNYNTFNNYSLENDYKILEVPSTATDEEVKKAYRSLAMKFHPDRVTHLGEEIRKDAEEKFTKLNQAYERIKKSRGMN